MHNNDMTTSTSTLLWFNDIVKEDQYRIGKKGVILGELLQAGFPLPNGFIVTTSAYFHFLHHNKLISKIDQLLSTINYDQPESVLQVSAHVKKLIVKAPLSESFIKEIVSNYNKLGSHHPLLLLLSEPNEHTEVINLSGDTNLMMKIKESWASFFEPKNLLQMYEKKLNHDMLSNALIVQKKVTPAISGLLFTIDPLTHFEKIVIETDHHLTDEQTTDLLRLGEKLKKYFYFPHEISWGIEKNNVIVLHTKPLAMTKPVAEKSISSFSHHVLLKGTPVSAGIQTGQVKIIKHLKDVERVHPGDILVAVETHDLPQSALKKAKAIITEKGGRTSHAALFARDHGIPAIVNATKATIKLKEQMIVTVNGTTGEVYQTDRAKIFPTATRLYANLTTQAAFVLFSEKYVDGIGPITANALLPQTSQEKQLMALCQKVQPHPVIYQLMDFHNDELQEEVEMLHTISKKSEIKNLRIMLPALSTLKELQQIKHFLLNNGLHRSPTLKLWLTIAAPSTIILLEEFIATGIDGIVIDVDTLTKNLLAGAFDALDPSVLWAIEKAIKTAHKHSITSSIFGSSLILHSSLIERVVTWGTTSISITPDRIDQTRNHILSVEQKLIG